MEGLLHLVQRRGAWVGCGSAQSFLSVSNVTVHPSTASVPINVHLLLYNGPLLCGSNVPIKWLIYTAHNKSVLKVGSNVSLFGA